MLRQRLDSQLLVGDGIAPNLAGILNIAGIQTFVLAGDRFDAVYEAIKRVRVIGQADPNVIVMHPNDWQELRLMRTNDGLYILGNPSEPGPVRIWGLPVVESTAETEGSVLTGDFANFCQLFEKKGVDIQISDSHGEYFIYNKKVIRADLRVGFPVYRPAAFCAITSF
jgi:HK97 family phage major capsid protein